MLKPSNLTRYAVREIETGELLEVGLNEREACEYAASYNRLMKRAGFSVEVIEITWRLKPTAAPATP
jgi:hypothetical protein